VATREISEWSLSNIVTFFECTLVQWGVNKGKNQPQPYPVFADSIKPQNGVLGNVGPKHHTGVQNWAALADELREINKLRILR